jgi:spermidine synthase
MPLPYEELAYADTAIGEISLRRRFDNVTQRSVLEVRLGDEFLMSSQFTVSEVELARRGLAAAVGPELSVMVAGLGLGFTAFEALQDPRTHQLVVIELLAPVLARHRDGLVPDTLGLATDPRSSLVEADFFDLVRAGRWTSRVDVLLVDIDHSPDALLDPGHRHFYHEEGLREAADMVTDDGSFALWSDDPPDEALLARMRTAFTDARADEVPFDNPVTGGTSSCTVYVAWAPRGR